MVLNESTPFKTVLEICSGDQVSSKYFEWFVSVVLISTLYADN